MDKKLNKYDVLSSEAITEIRWWYDNIMTSNAKIKSIPAIDYIINTDASNEGWGASDGTNPDINGRWFLHEKENHINVLELTAIKFAIEAYLPLRESTNHIRVFSDNTTAISYINKKGGTKCMVLNDLAFHIWQFCINYNAHLSAAHIPGAHNLLADIASRQFQDSAEWALPQHVLQNIISRFGKPDIDLFASRLNHKLPCYASWKPDPESSIIDAMSVSWSNRFIYMFPPFSMMWPVLTKMEEDQVDRAIIIMPRWSTQSWYPRIMKKVISPPFIIPSSVLHLPGTSKKHPLSPKLALLAVLCSWKDRTPFHSATQQNNLSKAP